MGFCGDEAQLTADMSNWLGSKAATYRNIAAFLRRGSCGIKSGSGEMRAAVPQQVFRIGQGLSAREVGGSFTRIFPSPQRSEVFKRMFLNINDRPSNRWLAEQREAALQLGGSIRDIAFPDVLVEAALGDVIRLADQVLNRIEEIPGGELVTYALVEVSSR